MQIEMLFGLWAWVGPGNHVLDGGPDRPVRRGNFLGRTSQTTCHPSRQQMRSYAAGAVVRLFPAGDECICWLEGWQGLANTIQPSMCGGDAAFCQITLTTCYVWCLTELHEITNIASAFSWWTHGALYTLLKAATASLDRYCFSSLCWKLFAT